MSYTSEFFGDETRYTTSLRDALLQTGVNVGSGQVHALVGVTLAHPWAASKLTFTYFHMMHSLVATLPVGSYITFASEQDVSIRITLERSPKAPTKEQPLPRSGDIVERLAYGVDWIEKRMEQKETK
jgi:hypothetical protein